MLTFFPPTKVRYSGRASHAQSSTPGTAWVPPPASSPLTPLAPPAPLAPPDPCQHIPQIPPPLHVDPGMGRPPPPATSPKRQRASETDGRNSTRSGGGGARPPPKRRRRKKGDVGSSAISDGDRYSITKPSNLDPKLGRVERYFGWGQVFNPWIRTPV